MKRKLLVLGIGMCLLFSSSLVYGNMVTIYQKIESASASTKLSLSEQNKLVRIIQQYLSKEDQTSLVKLLKNPKYKHFLIQKISSILLFGNDDCQKTGAARFLKHVKEPLAVYALLGAVNNSRQNLAIILTSVDALIAIEYPEAIPALLEGITHKNEDVRDWAAWSLKGIKDNSETIKQEVNALSARKYTEIRNVLQITLKNTQLDSNYIPIVENLYNNLFKKDRSSENVEIQESQEPVVSKKLEMKENIIENKKPVLKENKNNFPNKELLLKRIEKELESNNFDVIASIYKNTSHKDFLVEYLVQKLKEDNSFIHVNVLFVLKEINELKSFYSVLSLLVTTKSGIAKAKAVETALYIISMHTQEQLNTYVVTIVDTSIVCKAFTMLISSQDCTMQIRAKIQAMDSLLFKKMSTFSSERVGAPQKQESLKNEHKEPVVSEQMAVQVKTIEQMKNVLSQYHQTKSSKIILSLITLLKSPTRDERVFSMLALRKIGKEKVVEVLSSVFINKKEQKQCLKILLITQQDPDLQVYSPEVRSIYDSVIAYSLKPGVAPKSEESTVKNKKEVIRKNLQEERNKDLNEKELSNNEQPQEAKKQQKKEEGWGFFRWFLYIVSFEWIWG